MWVNLKRHILEEFTAFSRVGMDRDFYYRLRVVEPSEPRDRYTLARRQANKHRRMLRARIEVAARRPPCPHCGDTVERIGTTGTPPKYCTAACMRAAKWARWFEKNRKAAA